MLLTFKDGRLLTKGRFVSKVMAAISAAGVNCKPYSGHSFCIGVATAVGRCKLPPAMIKKVEQWESARISCTFGWTDENWCGCQNLSVNEDKLNARFSRTTHTPMVTPIIWNIIHDTKGEGVPTHLGWFG